MSLVSKELDQTDKGETMSIQHHGEESALQKRFLDELNGRAKRRWPDGRAGSDDDGELTFAIATDVPHGMIRVEFSKPTDWIGLNLEAAMAIRDRLEQGIVELRTGGH
jgi:hypothetical protein